MNNITFDSRMTATDAAEFKNVTAQSIHKELITKNLISNKNNNRVYFGHDTARKIFNINFNKNIISFQIVKGGTGKTSIGCRQSLAGVVQTGWTLPPGAGDVERSQEAGEA